MSIGVLIAVRGARESAVAAALDASRELTVARRCADLGEALAAAAAGVGAVVVLSEQPQLNRAVLGDFAAAGVAVVAAPSTAEAAEQLRALGVASHLAPDAPAGAIEAIVIQAARSAPEPTRASAGAAGGGGGVSERSRGAIVAVWGPTGAPGRTTVATALAFELARSRPVILADADTYGGAVAQALGLLDEAPGIAALARASLRGTLGHEAVARHALEAAPGLRVLSGVTRADRWPELSPAALEPVWEALRAEAAVTVVDCGFCLERDEDLQYDTRAPQRNGATLSVLSAADVVVAVGSAEPLGVQRLVHGLAELDDVAPAEAAARVVVVNRLRASVAGERPKEAVADALRRYAAVEHVWTVPWDPQACDAATLAGRALGERAPRSAARKAVAAIAHGVGGLLPAAAKVA